MLNSLDCFDISTFRWEEIKTKGRVPQPRHAHISCIVNDKLIIMGGTNSIDLYDKEN